MKNRNLRTLTVVAALSMVVGVSLSAFPLGGDIAIGSQIPIVGTQNYHNITINITKEKTCYKASTFVWSSENVSNSYPYFNLTGTLRIHVNFDQTYQTWFPNILKLTNTSNLSGFFNVTIDQYAKIGPNFMNSTYSSIVTVYISDSIQSIGNMGTKLTNNTTSSPFNLSQNPGGTYYIGVHYTSPSALPSYIRSDLNSLGEYIYFNFQFKLD